MVLRIIIAVAMWMGAVACALTASIANLHLVDDVNKSLPADRRFNPIGWYFAKHYDFKGAYERLGRGRYPPPRLRRLQVGALLFFAGMIIALAPFVFHGKRP
jgi:hypothetical protein